MSRHKWQILLTIIGLSLLLGGLFTTNIFESFSGDKVEVLGETTENKNIVTSEIVVEISGAIENPGVYKLPINSRINDLLILGGGLSETADREWVDKTINKAAKLTDGQKIYIPDYGQSSANNIRIDGNDNQTLNERIGLVDINSASQNELESLSGIGPKYASNIIEQRPYSDVNELVSKKVIPQKTFDKIKDQISVY